MSQSFSADKYNRKRLCSQSETVEVLLCCKLGILIVIVPALTVHIVDESY